MSVLAFASLLVNRARSFAEPMAISLWQQEANGRAKQTLPQSDAFKTLLSKEHKSRAEYLFLTKPSGVWPLALVVGSGLVGWLAKIIGCRDCVQIIGKRIA